MALQVVTMFVNVIYKRDGEIRYLIVLYHLLCKSLISFYYHLVDVFVFIAVLNLKVV